MKIDCNYYETNSHQIQFHSSDLNSASDQLAGKVTSGPIVETVIVRHPKMGENN